MNQARETANDDEVDPQIRLFQQRMAAAYAAFPAFSGLSTTEARQVAEQVRAPWTRGGPAMARTEELRIGTLQSRVRIHRPPGASTLAPALVYLHGGGWALFSLDTHDRLMREYAARAGVAVVGVDYSLAPEAKFPRALEETVAVVEALRDPAAVHGIDPARLALGGDSAGANLALATALALRERGRPLPVALLLNYGAFDCEADPGWQRYDGPRYMLGADEMHDFWNHYLRDAADRRDPLAVPIHADLRGLPPTFMAIAACDILADGNRRMADALRTAGVDVDARVYEGATHSFLEAVSISPLSDRALDQAGQWLRRRLAA